MLKTSIDQYYVGVEISCYLRESHYYISHTVITFEEDLILEITPQYLPLIRKTFHTYQNLEPDFTDAVLVTLADMCTIRQILTVDIRDFSVYRFNDGGAFTRLRI